MSSEIWFVGMRKVDCSAHIVARALSANEFRPTAQRASISNPGRPGGCEHARVLDRELEQQSRALVIRIARETRVGDQKAKIFAFPPVLRFGRGCVIEPPVA